MAALPPWLNINPLDYLQAAEAGSRMGLANREFVDKQQQEDVASDEHQQGLVAEGQQAKERIAAQALEDAKRQQFQRQQLAETAQNHQNTLLSSVAEKFLNNQRQRENSQNLLGARLATTGLEEDRLKQPKVIAPGDSVFDPSTGKFTLGPSKPASTLPQTVDLLKSYQQENDHILSELSKSGADPKSDQSKTMAQSFLDNQKKIQSLRELLQTPASGTSTVSGNPTGSQGPALPVGTDVPGKGMFVGGGFLNDGGYSTLPTPKVTPPKTAIDYLIANPDKAGDFDAKYGEGLSNQYLP